MQAKRTLKKYGVSTAAPLDLIWASIALGVASGVVHPESQRLTDGRSIQYTADWITQLKLQPELYTPSEELPPNILVHTTSGLPIKLALQLLSAIILRGPDWRASTSRIIRRSKQAIFQAIRATAVHGDAKYYRNMVIFVLARMAAGHIWSLDFVPKDEGTGGLDEHAVGSDQLPPGAAGLSSRQVTTLRQVRIGWSVYRSDAMFTHEGSQLPWQSPVSLLSTDGQGQQLGAPVPPQTYRATLVVLGWSPRADPTLNRDARIAQTLRHAGILVLTVSDTDCSLFMGENHLPMKMGDDDAKRRAFAKFIVDRAAPGAPIEVFLGCMMRTTGNYDQKYFKSDGDPGCNLRTAAESCVALTKTLLEALGGRATVRVPITPCGRDSSVGDEVSDILDAAPLSREATTFTTYTETASASDSIYWWSQIYDDQTGENAVSSGPGDLFTSAGGSKARMDAEAAFVRVTVPRGGGTLATPDALAIIAKEIRRRAIRKRREVNDHEECQACAASSTLYLTDEHPRSSNRRKPPINALGEWGLTGVSITQCGICEGILKKAATMYTNAFDISRPFRLPCCGSDGYECGHLTVPPTAGAKSAGRHRWTIGGNRSYSNVGRAAAPASEVKDQVPQMYYAELANAIEQREGENFSTTRTWLSLCAGQHSDRLAAMAAGYTYVPVDVKRWAKGFGGWEPNYVLDMTTGDLVDFLTELLGDDGLLRIGVISICVPCETHSSLNPGKHRDPDTLQPRRGAAGQRAREVDAIQLNIDRFLAHLVALRQKHRTRCTCSSSDEANASSSGRTPPGAGEGPPGPAAP